MIVWRKTGRFGHAEVFAAIAVLSFVVAWLLPLLPISYTCPLKGITGLPCATCGMTRAFVRLAHGDPAGAVAASPLGALLALGAWTYAVADAVRVALGAPLPVPSPRALRAATALGIAALLVNWAWLVVREGRS
jgi:hypothetical protein